ncbi:MAG: ATP phosphoribosyltransferase [Actinobacteria bacterium]|nr:ATP phosphoribosyltransferase [Actinomycetota bacterium]MCL6105682.1 ATP phosphoribosyltransferase [Actinomycetota bacterium]
MDLNISPDLQLSLVLPKGSLEKATMDLFMLADLAVHRSSPVDYHAKINDPRIKDVRILRPQEIPGYVADGLFDFGVTGSDWIEETQADVVQLGQLGYSKATRSPVRIVLAVEQNSSVQKVTDLSDGTKISTEYPQLTKRYLEDRGIKADIRLSYGATEAKVPDIVDAVVEITETGRALELAGLRIVETLRESTTELIANPKAAESPEKFTMMNQILTLLQGAMEARDKVLIKLNVTETDLPKVLDLLPSMKAPTVSELARNGGYAVETVVLKADINILIPKLVELGATDIIELPISKIISSPSLINFR